MRAGSRFAIYFAPEEDTALARFGWPWLGRRPDSDADAPFPAAVAGDVRHAAIVAAPQLYGLHGTLKPPFHLRDRTARAELLTALQAFCATRRPFASEPLVLGEIGGFLALLPPRESGALHDLAADCVTAFDRFRAPASAEDIAKRVAQGLTPRQRALLDRWGYPYVLDEFRFHVTLTDRLDDAERSRVRGLLDSLLDKVAGERVQFRSLCLFEQPRPGSRFILAARVPFRNAPAKA